MAERERHRGIEKMAGGDNSVAEKQREERGSDEMDMERDMMRLGRHEGSPVIRSERGGGSRFWRGSGDDDAMFFRRR